MKGRENKVHKAQRQESETLVSVRGNCELSASLIDIVRPYLKTKAKKSNTKSEHPCFWQSGVSFTVASNVKWHNCDSSMAEGNLGELELRDNTKPHHATELPSEIYCRGRGGAVAEVAFEPERKEERGWEKRGCFLFWLLGTIRDQVLLSPSD